MELDQIKECLKKQLKQSRYLHSLGVEEVACDMAVIYGYDMEKAALAGILHDCAKYLSDEDLISECEKYGLPISAIERKCAFLLHAKVGAFYARVMYGIEDEEILDSITYHTTGRPEMTILEKIIFTADYIEPYRKPLPRINEIREAAYSELDRAIVMILENTLGYLRESDGEIDTVTVDTFHYYQKLLV
jgi:predicted HD superfamily hydrolase involved in NAD metabolism